MRFSLRSEFLGRKVREAWVDYWRMYTTSEEFKPHYLDSYDTLSYHQQRVDNSIGGRVASLVWEDAMKQSEAMQVELAATRAALLHTQEYLGHVLDMHTAGEGILESTYREMQTQFFVNRTVLNREGNTVLQAILQIAIRMTVGRAKKADLAEYVHRWARAVVGGGVPSSYLERASQQPLIEVDR